MTEQGVYLRHLSVEIVKDLSDRTIRGQGRGLGPWPPSLGLSKAEYNRDIRSEEEAPASALDDLDEEADACRALQQLAGAGDTQAQPIGHGLRAEQRLKAGQCEQPGEGSRPVLRDNGALSVAVDALETVEPLKACSRGPFELFENPKPIGLVGRPAEPKSLRAAGEAGEGRRADTRFAQGEGETEPGNDRAVVPAVAPELFERAHEERMIGRSNRLR